MSSPCKDIPGFIFPLKVINIYRGLLNLAGNILKKLQKPSKKIIFSVEKSDSVPESDPLHAKIISARSQTVFQSSEKAALLPESASFTSEMFRKMGKNDAKK